MISSKTPYVVVAASILLLIAYTVTQRNQDAPLVGTPTTSAAENSGVATGPTTQAEPDAKPKRSFLTDDSSTSLLTNVTPLLTDVPESQLDHQILESFLRVRPIGAYRIVRIDSDSLRTIIRQSADVPGFDIQLLDSDPTKLITHSAIEHSSGWQTGLANWSGIADGGKAGRSSFVIAPDATVSGVFYTLQHGRIKIEPIPGTPHHIVWQWDPGYTKKID